MTDHPALNLDLGTRTVNYSTADAILYALAVGAPASELDLVYERDLQVLPTYGLVLARWGMEALREAGHYRAEEALHGAQRLRVLKPLPAEGAFDISARVTGAWDKGSAAVYDVTATSDYFESVSSVFARNRGGWGGDRGPASLGSPETEPIHEVTFSTSPDQNALYRLTGDWHTIHIDPEAARSIGAPRPILHGLCTAGFAVRVVADALGVRPWALQEFEVRFSAFALPGEPLTVRIWEPTEGRHPFSVSSENGEVLSGGRISFRSEQQR